MSMEIKNLLGIDLEQMPQYLQRAPDYASQQPEPEQKESAGSQIGGLALDVLRGIAHGYAPRTMGAIEQFVQQRELKKRIGGAPQIGAGTDRNMTYQALMQRADILESMGDVESADTMRQRALQFSPTPIYATSTFNAQAPDGSIVRRATSQTGEIMDFGNVSASPDTLANIGSARSAERARAALTQMQNSGRIAVANINASGKSKRAAAKVSQSPYMPASQDDGLIPMPTGKVTQEQRSTLGYADRMLQAEKALAGVQGGEPTEKTEIAGSIPLVGGYMRRLTQSDSQQQFSNLANEWIRAKLRKESGAAIGVDEMQKEFETYFPQPGDSAAVIKQKARLRQNALQSMARQAGSSVPTTNQPRKRYNPATGKIESY